MLVQVTVEPALIVKGVGENRKSLTKIFVESTGSADDGPHTAKRPIIAARAMLFKALRRDNSDSSDMFVSRKVAVQERRLRMNTIYSIFSQPSRTVGRLA
jgi:hypothetical protein